MAKVNTVLGPMDTGDLGFTLMHEHLLCAFPNAVTEYPDILVPNVLEYVVAKLKLAKAGAYLPTAGIHVKEVQLAMHLEKELVRIDSFRALSGPGHIE
ncbi:MAG: hypothetical protein MUQ20_02340, partial [Deltaproteobacteria bacterium]|nr:hypothetical protein [Deltaproteobacteria bacterium]